VVAVVAGQPTTSDAVVPAMAAAGIPWVGSSPVSQSEISSDDAFFFGPGAVGNLGAYAQYSADLGYRSVVIYGVDTPQLNGLIGTVGKAIFGKAGIQMRLVSVPAGPIDATDLVEQGLADKPDAVLVLSESSVCRSVLTALEKVGSTQPRLVGTCVRRPRGGRHARRVGAGQHRRLRRRRPERACTRRPATTAPSCSSTPPATSRPA
jgi:branched-chain amino acid transport system substrate-binding protein